MVEKTQCSEQSDVAGMNRLSLALECTFEWYRHWDCLQSKQNNRPTKKSFSPKLVLGALKYSILTTYFYTVFYTVYEKDAQIQLQAKSYARAGS
jgi:hypothetical protein